MRKNDQYKPQDSEKDLLPYGLDRREFLKLVGGGIVIFFSTGESSVMLYSGQREYPEDFNAYLKIGIDGRVSCFTGKIEMGQGIHTSLAQMLAEELDIPLDSVDMVMGDTDLCPWDAGTFGSRSTKYFGPPLRRAAAEARAVLIEMAAQKLDLPKETLVAKQGIIFNKNNTDEKISYADLVQGKKIDKHLQEKPDIKPYSQHIISGKPTDRMDAEQKVTGQAKFTGDIHLPGMLYARILRAPAHGGKILSVDTSDAEKIKDIQIIRDGDSVAVLHKYPDVAEKALGLIKAQYQPSSSKLDNDSIFKHLRRSAAGGDVVTEAGELEVGKDSAVKTFVKTYYNQYVAHAPTETHTAVVSVEGDKAEVWASTQSPFRAQGEVARTLEIPLENVRVRTPFVGCGFGGKNQGQQIVEAARLAKLVNKPVQVAWTRKEEFFLDTFRPAAVIEVNTGIDQNNQIVFWEYDNYFAGSRSSEPLYNIPHHRVRSFGSWGGRGGGSPHPFGVGAWQGPGSNTNVFAMESQMDVMAAEAGIDPLNFRLINLTDKRMIKVLSAAAERFGRSFEKAPSGKGYGIAITNYLGTYVATMAEVKVDKNTGSIRAERVVCAQDTGEVINPEGVRMQIEGCIIMGLGYSLTEEIEFKDGKILTENFDTYEIPRFSWLPKIETVLVNNPEMPPQGCGEPAVTPMGAVMANAVFDAVGIRMFTLPMTPDRIKEALDQKA